MKKVTLIWFKEKKHFFLFHLRIFQEILLISFKLLQKSLIQQQQKIKKNKNHFENCVLPKMETEKRNLSFRKRSSKTACILFFFSPGYTLLFLFPLERNCEKLYMKIKYITGSIIQNRFGRHVRFSFKYNKKRNELKKKNSRMKLKNGIKKKVLRTRVDCRNVFFKRYHGL